MIGPIRQEVLSGLKEGSQFEKLERHLATFPDLRLENDDYVVAAKFSNACRTKSIQNSNADFLICAVAVRRQHAIFTNDKDFARFAKQLPIVLHDTGSASPGAQTARLKRHADLQAEDEGVGD
jgi:predicted nucleic acid-binding protein